MRGAEEVTFGAARLDRAARFRGDAEAIARLWADPQTRCLPLWRDKPLITAGPSPALGWQTPQAQIFAGCTRAPVFLGLDDGAALFARPVPDWAAQAVPEGAIPYLDRSRQSHPALPEGFEFAELRAVMAELDPADAAHAAIARGILAWHATHRHCARCGAPSVSDQAGWRRRCPDCGAYHFPRTDPVVIMLILHGNSVLLGRSPGWPEGMYSLLAGYVEPGETIEAAVRREVMEEAQVPVGDVQYLASQPWPFPSSLMIGCLGEALATEITRDPVEIEDALWLTREQTLETINGRREGMFLARRGSIARFLIERWLADRLA